jgi:opacity protein-like surface antigen
MLMNKILLLATALVMSAAAGHASAQSGFYVSAFAGSDSPDKEVLDGINAAGLPRLNVITLDDGPIYGGSLGVASTEYGFGRFRAEIEVSSRDSDLEGVDLNGVARTIRPDRNVGVTTGLLQVIYDTPVYFDRLRFHAGAGYGLVNVNHNIGYLVANAVAIGSSPGNSLISITNSETTSGHQWIAGAEVLLSPRWSLTADVRSLEVGEMQTQRFVENAVINGVPTTLGTLDAVQDADYSSVSWTVGLKYAF